MQYARFFAVWLLSSLILGVVHGPAMGTFFGLGIALGYVIAYIYIETPAVTGQHKRLRKITRAIDRRLSTGP
jgi:hypothetical protein